MTVCSTQESADGSEQARGKVAPFSGFVPRRVVQQQQQGCYRFHLSHKAKTKTSTTRLYGTFALINIEPTKQLLVDNVNDSTSNAIVNNYVPAATTLFVNMITPASILAAGMISIGLKSPFQLPDSIQDQPDKV